MTAIVDIMAREILDSRGNPTDRSGSHPRGRINGPGGRAVRGIHRRP
jgi:hypothetical protein